MTIDEEVLEAVTEELAQCLHEAYMGRLSLYAPSIRRMAENCIIVYEQVMGDASTRKDEEELSSQNNSRFSSPATSDVEMVRELVAALEFVRHRDSRWHDDAVVTPIITKATAWLAEREK